MDGGTIEDTWSQIVAQIGSEAAAQFLREAAAREVNGVETGVPGLTGEVAGAIASAKEDDQLLTVLEPSASSRAVPAFPIVGSILGGTDRRTWRMTSVATYSECIFGFVSCSVTDRRTTSITIDPGPTGNRIQYNQSYFPSTDKIEKPSYTVRAYRNGSLNGTKTTTVGIGSTTVTLSNQSSLRANGFAFTVTGSAIINDSLVNLPPARTGDGACTSASQPVCRFAL